MGGPSRATMSPMTRVLLCLCLLAGCGGDGAGTDAGSPPLDSGAPVDAATRDDSGGAVDGGDGSDSGAAGTEVCGPETIDLAEDGDPGLLDARLCFDQATNTCMRLNGTDGCDPFDTFVARWARDARTSPLTRYMDTNGFNSLEDNTHGSVAPGFALADLPLDTEVSVTLNVTEPVAYRLRLTFTMTETNVTIGPIVRL